MARVPTVGRQNLPIPHSHQPYPGLVTYDAKDPATSFAPTEELRPPAGAPNVLVVLLDDVGFAASSAFGGPAATPVAERLAASAGIGREPLVALVRASVENWAASGAAAALTGPIARGDEQTVEHQRAAVAERAPDDLDLYDALTAATRRLAAERTTSRGGGLVQDVHMVDVSHQTQVATRV